jgi:hypothetical protein
MEMREGDHQKPPTGEELVAMCDADGDNALSLDECLNCIDEHVEDEDEA